MAFIDSCSLPMLPEVLMIALVLHHPFRLPWYALVATAGSTAGSVLLFALVRHWGGPWTEHHLPGEKFQRMHRWFERHEVLAVALPAVLPPPLPFKIFIVGAGVFEMSYPHFSASMAAGRGLRYFLEAWLALRFGAQVLAVLRHHPVSVLLVSCALLGLGYGLGRRKIASS